MKVSERGEFGFIDDIKSNTIINLDTIVCGIGDDCAVYRTTDEYEQLITTDMMVAGIHFSDQTTAPFDVGYRLGAANISDIAAMGGEPRQAVIAAAIPADTDIAYMESVYDGFKAICKKYGVNIVGGDTVTTTGPLVLNVTLVGEVPKSKAVLRSGAQIGDLVVVTNTIGNAAAGLAVLLAKQHGLDFIKQCHQRPEPQVILGNWLREHKATSLNDISDGLGSELNEIAKASGVAIEIDETKIPLHEELREAAEILEANSLDWALYGGEDFQLTGTLPADLADIIDEHPHIHIIGRVIAGPSKVHMHTVNGERKLIESKGYDHFKHKL